MMPYQQIFFYTSLAIFLAVFLIQIFWRKNIFKIIRPLFWVTVFATFGYSFYISFLQYQAFQSGPLNLILGTSKGLLWFIGYVRLHFWNQFVISLLGALLIFLFAKYMNKKMGERFFEREEIYIGALGVFLVGYPAWIFYIVLVLLASVIASAIFLRKGERMPLYVFWIPAAIITILIVQFWAMHQSWWNSLRF